jgi:hypothetical protein
LFNGTGDLVTSALDELAYHHYSELSRFGTVAPSAALDEISQSSSIATILSSIDTPSAMRDVTLRNIDDYGSVASLSDIEIKKLSDSFDIGVRSLDKMFNIQSAVTPLTGNYVRDVMSNSFVKSFVSIDPSSVSSVFSANLGIVSINANVSLDISNFSLDWDASISFRQLNASSVMSIVSGVLNLLDSDDPTVKAITEVLSTMNTVILALNVAAATFGFALPGLLLIPAPGVGIVIAVVVMVVSYLIDWLGSPARRRKEEAFKRSVDKLLPVLNARNNEWYPSQLSALINFYTSKYLEATEGYGVSDISSPSSIRFKHNYGDGYFTVEVTLIESVSAMNEVIDEMMDIIQGFDVTDDRPSQFLSALGPAVEVVSSYARSKVFTGGFSVKS